MDFANEIMPYFFAPYANIYRKMHCAAHQKEFREKLLFPLHRRQQRHRFAILLLLFQFKRETITISVAILVRKAHIIGNPEKTIKIELM